MRLLWAILVMLSYLAPARAVDDKAIDAVILDGMKSWQVPGVAVAIVQGDEVVYCRGFGVRALESDSPVTPDTVFAIASCTKAFVATVAGLLVDDGKLHWDDPVRKHLPYFRLSDPLAESQVTLRDLLCHRTGLSRHDGLRFNTDWTHEEVIRRIGLVKLTQPFRTTWQYNNIMYMTSGLAVGSAANGTWEDFVQKRLFEPLGMSSAVCTTAAAEKSPHFARPYWRNDAGQVTAAPWLRFDRGNAAGSIHASVRDMARWVRFQLGDGTSEGKRILSKTQFAETHTPQMVMRLEGATKDTYPDTTQISYGLGWFIHDHRGVAMLSHTGGLSGYRARIVLVPKAKLGLVLLSNSGVGSSYASMHYVVTNTLLDQLLGLPTKDWNAYYTAAFAKLEGETKAEVDRRLKKRHEGTKPSHELAAYAGNFEDPAYGTTEILLKGPVLAARWGRARLRLGHFHFDTFMTDAANDDEWKSLDKQPIVFQLDADGKVASLRWLGQEFKRTTQKAKPPR